MEEAIVTFPCDTCGKNFAYKYALKRHAKYCGAVVPEACSNCKKVLKNHASLQTHERRCLGVDKELPCWICKKTFRQVYNLRRHLRTCHSIEDPAIVNADMPEETHADSQKKIDDSKPTENRLGNSVTEEIYTLRFGTKFDDSDISVYKLTSPGDEVNGTIDIERDGEEDNHSGSENYVFQYEDSSDEEWLLDEISNTTSRKTS